MFKVMNENEMFDVFGGDFLKDLGYAFHAWVDFWGNFGEGAYDALH